MKPAPDGAATSATRTPSIVTSNCSELAPRTNRLVWLPRPPLRAATTAGQAFQRAGQIRPLHRGKFILAQHGNRLAGPVDPGVPARGSDDDGFAANGIAARVFARPGRDRNGGNKTGTQQKQIFHAQTSSNERMPFMARGPATIAGPRYGLRYTPAGAERPSSAGLLAPGSARLPRLPGLSRRSRASGIVGAALPGHSCGGSAGFGPLPS